MGKKNLTSSGGGVQDTTGEIVEENKGAGGAKENLTSSGGDKDKTETPIEESKNDGDTKKNSTSSGGDKGETPKETGTGGGTGRKPPKPPKAETEEVVASRYSNEAISDQSLANKILNHIAYRLKIGVDYKFTPQIIGAVGFNVGGSLYNLLQLQVGTGIELGIRYNF